MQPTIGQLNINQPVLSIFHSEQDFYVSPRTRHRLGITTDQATSWPDLLRPEYLLHPDDLDRVLEESEAMDRTGIETRIDQRMLMADGKYHRMVGRRFLHPDASGNCQQKVWVDVGNAPFNSVHFDHQPRRKNHIPRVAFDLEGVLMNTQQAILDYAVMQGIPGYDDIMTWEKCSSLIPCLCPTCAMYLADSPEVLDSRDLQLANMMHSYTDLYQEAPAFPDVDLTLLSEAARESSMLAYFLGSAHLPNAASMAHNWLHSHGLEEHQAVLPDFCQQEKVDFIRNSNIDFYLTDHPELVLQLRALRIPAFLMDRPWNRTAAIPFRIHSLHDFLNRTVFFSQPMNELQTQ